MVAWEEASSEGGQDDAVGSSETGELCSRADLAVSVVLIVYLQSDIVPDEEDRVSTGREFACSMPSANAR